ncbi:MAG: A/G-specific adenine glycosylase, partial [Opitutaceae bacterium]
MVSAGYFVAHSAKLIAQRRSFQRALHAWYRVYQRQLPWRIAPSLYKTVVSEFMLQQTQVKTVLPYFDRWLHALPDFTALAAAPESQVMKLWEGLGYYSRARNLHKLAQQITALPTPPRTPAQWRELPGIGPYTAAAIASIAYGLPYPVVDSNVARVGARLWCIMADTRTPRVQRDLERRLLDAVGRSGDPSAFNQALMELGALVCRPRDPLCTTCPLRANCRALATGRTADLPVRRPAARVPHYHVAVGIVEHEGRVLIARRAEDQMLGGLWEFPGGKQEKGEKPA